MRDAQNARGRQHRRAVCYRTGHEQQRAFAAKGAADLVGDVVDDDDAVGAAVVGRGDELEAVLASGVPDLQLDFAVLDRQRPHLEVGADGRDERLRERVLLPARRRTERALSALCAARSCLVLVL
eukprot:69752-Rhodomonas_salina.2